MTTSLILFIALTTVLNLGLGYALAMYQGHGPPLGLWGPGMPRLKQSVLGPSAGLMTEPRPAPAVATEPADVAAVPESPACEPPGETPESPPPPSADSGAYQEAIAKSRDDAQQHRQQLMQLNQQVRDVQETPTRADLDQCTSDLVGLNQDYLQRQEENLQQAADNVPESAAIQAINGDVRQAGQSHAGDIQTSLDEIGESKMSDGNLDDYCRRLLAESDRQIDSSGGFHDTLETAIGSVIEAERGPATESTPGQEEPEADVTSVESAVARILSRWRDDGGDKHRPLTAAVMELDQFEKIPGRLGPEIVGRFVQAVQGVLATSREEGGELVLTSGHQFIFAYQGMSAQWVGASLERIRQMIEKTEFKCGGTTLCVTVSAAAVDAAGDDTANSLCERLLASVDEAHRSGHNRTVLHEGQAVKPIVPPRLDIPESVVEL